MSNIWLRTEMDREFRWGGGNKYTAWNIYE